jgi:hypothetical protein
MERRRRRGARGGVMRVYKTYLDFLILWYSLAIPEW